MKTRSPFRKSRIPGKGAKPLLWGEFTIAKGKIQRGPRRGQHVVAIRSHVMLVKTGINSSEAINRRGSVIQRFDSRGEAGTWWDARPNVKAEIHTVG